jgi:hypothetical protein
MSKEAQLNEALNFLANNWRHTASLREPIQAALDKLGAEPYLKVRYASAHFVVYQVVTSVAAHWPGSP